MSVAKAKHQKQSSTAPRKHFWDFSIPIPAAMLISIVLMAALVGVVVVFNVPNPNMILVTGLVVCAALFGYPGSIPAAIIMLGYTLFFFSTGNDFITFSETNLQKVITTVIGVIVITVFVSQLRRAIAESFAELHELTTTLEEDNQLLEEASSRDSLTGTCNRFALRRDFGNYLNQKLHVMMIDVDNLKVVNDRFGHESGDRALAQMGALLTELYGQDCVYRYGGDEFLVIYSNATVADFQRLAITLKERTLPIHANDLDIPIRFSAGYVYGTPKAQSDLRLMIRHADLNLYASKSAGKNQITGCAYSQAVAEKAAARPHTLTERENDAPQHRHQR